MIRPRDREYAGILSSVIMAGYIVKYGLPQFENIVPAARECVNLAVQVMVGVDNHLPRNKDHTRKRR